MQALALHNVGYATNADHGFGCNIHPSAKQYVSKRLAHSALAQHYQLPDFTQWKSPSYKAASVVASNSDGSGSVSVMITLADLSSKGLKTVHPFNYASPQYGSNATAPFIPVDCTATFPATYPNRTAYNASMSEQCAWASLQLENIGWVNASIDVSNDGRSLLLTAVNTANASGLSRSVRSAWLVAAGSFCVQHAHR